ncbi:hypothetical protein SAMN03080617_02604 [Algoriphagus alkaliphilus]|uniref:Uncharacterized protein n=1 Tax=Algoriphagus alkaliphilus TaxID=279824 RepID=A0A1G5YK38_9BACT|nr:hypothetical protein [Algoriphagus alkaliphilus]MBA4299615.1 hypothetical protein [Cyclobacterium sp.]SDA82684.1 hypothetical protein SAMN03080617_02604 [Algoriphagus alkaliphilus]
MELKSPQALRFGLPEEIVKEFFYEKLPPSFAPSIPELGIYRQEGDPTLFALDLFKTLEWLHDKDYPRPLGNEVCAIPVMLSVPDFSTEHLLFHFDGSPNSVELIRKFIDLFGDLIKESKATIISPNFIPKSKIREEREIIQLVTSNTKETSFIKFNFSRIGDFWSYGVKNDCTLLVTTKNYQAELAKVLFHFYQGKIWSNKLSFYLSV